MFQFYLCCESHIVPVKVVQCDCLDECWGMLWHLLNILYSNAMLLNSSVEACFGKCVRVTGCTYSWMTHRVWGLLEIYNNQLNLGKSGADRIFTFGMWGTGTSQKKTEGKKDSVTPLLTPHLQQNALQSRMSQRKWHPGGHPVARAGQMLGEEPLAPSWI